MRRFEISKIKKIIAAMYTIYLVAYIIGAAVTMLVLYKDQICNFFRRVGLKMTCMINHMRDKIHPTKMDSEWLKEAMKDAPVIHMSDLERFDDDSNYGVEFACSEE